MISRLLLPAAFACLERVVAGLCWLRGEALPGSDEGVLDGVLRGIPIAEDPPRDRVQAVVCGGCEVIEGLAIASLCALDEFGRQRRPLGS